MTALLIGTFTVGGLHTALWLPRALKMRRERNERERLAEAAAGSEKAVSAPPETPKHAPPDEAGKGAGTDEEGGTP
jgi:hypothetical protein